MAAVYYSAGSFRFLRALARNNNREWFQAHKAEYEREVKAPSLQLVADMGDRLAALSKRLVADARPVGGSLFRIYRDTRFSKDKTPYKTHVGITFYHAATRGLARGGSATPGRLDAPVLYLHIEPGACFMGGGLWHPQPETLKRVRDYLIDNPRSWQRITRAPSFRSVYELSGDALARPPRGYSPTHPLIEDLKRKDFVATAQVSDAEAQSAKLPALLVQRYRRMNALMEWLSGAVGLPY
jgi:uncharacterized protein (TIGR02453 family)